MNEPSSAERVFRSWELVTKIFHYLPWYDVCRLRNLSSETRYACQYCVQEIENAEEHKVEGNSFLAHDRGTAKIEHLIISAKI